MDDAPWSLLDPPPGALPPSSLRLRWIDADEQLERSHGPIPKPETINYRTHRPERGGLFCEEIFGPAPKDPADVLLRFSSQLDPFEPAPRARRFGHVALCAPVVHPLVLRHEAESLAEALGLPRPELERVLRSEAWVVLDPADSPLSVGTVLDESDDLPAGVIAGTGAAALATLHEEAWGDSPIFMRTLLVLPPDLRPLVPLDGGRFATADVNDLYRRVINRNNRTKRLLELNAPEIILRNETRMLQESVEQLFLNDGERVATGPGQRPLKSLWAVLGQGESPWARVQQLDDRVRADPRASDRLPTGPQHWVQAHLAALGLALEPG